MRIQNKNVLKSYKKYDRTLKGKYRRLKNKTITFKYFCMLQKRPCYYCGGPLPETGHGIDRIDSSKGYDKGNVRACCAHCNSAKNSMSEIKFFSLIEAIYKNYLKRK